MTIGSSDQADPQAVLAELAHVKALFQGRAIAAIMGDTLAGGTGIVRLTVDGVEHITPAEFYREPEE